MTNGKPLKNKRVSFTLETKELCQSNITSARSMGPSHGCSGWTSEFKQSNPAVLCKRDSLGQVGEGDWKSNTLGSEFKARRDQVWHE